MKASRPGSPSRSLLLSFVLAAFAAAMALVPSSAAIANHFVQPATPAQGFNPSVIDCIGALAPNPEVALGSCSGTENLLLGDAPTIETAVRVPGGTRSPEQVHSYTGPGWRFPGGGLTAPALASTQGGVKETIDLLCNGVIDVVADASSTAANASVALSSVPPTWVPLPFTDVTTAWTSATGPAGQLDETYLDRVLPPTGVMSRAYRLRAAVTSIKVGAGLAAIDPAAPINTVALVPSWSPRTLLNATLPGLLAGEQQRAGPTIAPTTDKGCTDTPRDSIANTPAGSVLACNGGCTGLAANPVRAGADVGSNGRDDNTGYYARWTVLVSVPDIVTGERQGTIALTCKYVSADFPAGTGQVAPPAGSDSDGDCLEDAATAEPGRPVDANDTVADQDGDGVGDGVEVAWGSCPNNAHVFTVPANGFSYNCAFLNGVSGSGRSVAQARDTDQDGRSDLEELLGSDLSNPRSADTDGDAAANHDGDAAHPITGDFAGCSSASACNDGGLAWDADDDGAPDHVLAAGGTQTLLGSSGCPSLPCSPARVNPAFQITADTFRPYEGDNCTNISNAAQANTDSGVTPFTSTTLIGLGIATDGTNPHEDMYGDACDTDNDNDSFVDAAEASNRWVTGFLGKSCDIVSENGNAAAPTDPTRRDSDNDGTLDGQECQGGTNPADGCGAALPCAGYAPTYGTGTFTNLPLDASNGCGGTIQDPPCGGDDALGPLGELLQRTTGINQTEGGALSCGAATGQLCDIDQSYVGNSGTMVGTVNNGTADGDSDADGLLDSYEAFVHGTSPANQDTDGDGCPDGVEVVSVTSVQNRVEFGDLNALLAVWNKTRGSAGPAYDPLLDYNGSGKIDFGDLSLLLALWGKVCTAGAVLESATAGASGPGAADIHMTPNPKTAAMPSSGNTFTVDISGVPADLSGYSAVASYDGTVINVTGISDTSGLPSIICPGNAPDMGGGALGSGADWAFESACGTTSTPTGLPAGTISLATVTFTCLRTGTTAIVFTVSDATGAGRAPLSPTHTNGSVTCGNPVDLSGFWRINYTGTLSANAYCALALTQTGSFNASGPLSCTDASLGTVSPMTIDQDAMTTTATVTFPPFGYSISAPGTFVASGNSWSGSWSCISGCVGSGNWTGTRIQGTYSAAANAATNATIITAVSPDNTEVKVTPGVLSGPTTIGLNLEPLPAAPPAGFRPLRTGYKFTPAGAGPFNAPGVEVVFHYTLGDIPAGTTASDLKVYIWNTPTPDIWNLVGGTVNTSLMTITVGLLHFSEYGIFAPVNDADNDGCSDGYENANLGLGKKPDNPNDPKDFPDADRSGRVGVSDFSRMLNAWNKLPGDGTPPYNPTVNFDVSNPKINVGDFSLLNTGWNRKCVN